MGIGDWGLGIGPNPQSPIPNPHYFILLSIYIRLITSANFNINKLYLIYNKNKGHLKNKYNKITN